MIPANNLSNIFKNIRYLNQKTDQTLILQSLKIAEEFGELIQEINKLIGNKKRKSGETTENIYENILEESADLIQNTISLLILLGYDENRLISAINSKNEKWNNL